MASGVVLIGGALWALDVYSVFGPSYLQRPELEKTPPLKPVSQMSKITVPVTVELAAIRSTIDATAPRSFTGKRQNPIAGPFIKSEIGWTIKRDALALIGKADGLALSAQLSGKLAIGDSVTGSTKPDPIGGMLDAIVGAFDQRGEVRGNVTMIARPTLMPNWRIDPKLSGQVAIPHGGLTFGGLTIDVEGDVKDAIDHAVSEQVGALQKQVRNDTTIEQVARAQWSKMCRSVSLAGVASGSPNLFLQLRPVRAYAAHPLIDANAATVTLGVEAETKIVATDGNPDCPFPAQLEIVAPVDQGRFAIAAPIEIPFAELNRLLNMQLKGRTFPEGADATAQATVLNVDVAPSGDQLLITLRVKAQEQATWFGFGGWATLYIWVRPQLDQAEQKLRLTDMALDVRTRAAFGLLSVAARIAISYIQEVLEQYAVIDLKPYAASARTGIEAIVADFDKQDDGVNASASITDLRMVGVEFDSATLRMNTEIEGSAKLAITKLPAQKQAQP